MFWRFSFAPSITGGKLSLSGPFPMASPWTITWCFESTIAWPLYPWTVPWDVCIFAESLSVTLLWSSFPLLPIFLSCSVSHFSTLSACCWSLLICFSRLVDICSSTVSSVLSTSIWSSTNDLILHSIFPFFFFKSSILPLHSLEALEDILQPSMAKKVPPKSCSCSHTSNISLNSGLIWSFMEETNDAMVLWSGLWLQDIAIKVTFSQHARSIWRDDIKPRE